MQITEKLINLYSGKMLIYIYAHIKLWNIKN